MQQNNKNNNSSAQEKFPPAETGNASNPSPQEGSDTPTGNQLIDQKGEKYLREVAPVEDYPDEQEWEEANNVIEEEKDSQSGKA